MINYILFIVGFPLLIYGANFLVDGAAAVAKKFNIPNLVIGMTIVALGTSAPEFVVSAFASISENADIAIGNVLGSNLINTWLILGISAIIYPIQVQKRTAALEIPFTVAALIILGVMANDHFFENTGANQLGFIDGFLLLSFFIFFMVYNFHISKKADDLPEEIKSSIKILPAWKAIMFILLGLAGLIFGGRWIVDGAVFIAEKFQISQAVISLTIIAVGTSLPELAVCVVAAMKKNSDMAIGNIVGSNLFNIFFILGSAALMNRLVFTQENIFDLFITLLSSVMLLVFVFIGKGLRLSRIEGGIFLGSYLVYLIYLITRTIA